MTKTFTIKVEYRNNQKLQNEFFDIDKSQVDYLKDQLEVVENNSFLLIKRLSKEFHFINLSDVVKIVISQD